MRRPSEPLRTKIRILRWGEFKGIELAIALIVKQLDEQGTRTGRVA